jgi:hypothetical protein
MPASHPADKSIINCKGFRQLKTQPEAISKVKTTKSKPS